MHEWFIEKIVLYVIGQKKKKKKKKKVSKKKFLASKV